MGKQIIQYGTQRSGRRDSGGHRVGRGREGEKRKIASGTSFALVTDGGEALWDSAWKTTSVC